MQRANRIEQKNKLLENESVVRYLAGPKDVMEGTEPSEHGKTVVSNEDDDFDDFS